MDVCTRDAKFEPTGPALDPKSDPAGLERLRDLNASCWAHAGLRMNSPMLKGFAAGLDSRLFYECWA